MVTKVTTYDFTDKVWYLAEAVRVNLGSADTLPASFDKSTMTAETTSAISQAAFDAIIATFEAGTGYVPVKRDRDYTSIATVGTNISVVQADNEKVIFSYIFPANTLVKGQQIRLNLWGLWDTINSNQPFINLRYRLGATTTKTGAIMNKRTISTADLTARLFTTNNKNNYDWEIASVIEIQSLGTSGVCLLSGKYFTSLNTQSEYRTDGLRQVAGTHVIDTTIDRLLEVTLDWGASAGSGHKILLNTARLELGV